MKAGILPYAVMKPLSAPIPAPRIRVKRIAGQKPMPQNFRELARIIVSSAIIDPGLRSMPPMKITAVEPMASSATTLTWSARLFMFPQTRNRSVVDMTSNATTIVATTGPVSG